ncbi:mycofactocin biosynthesis glycosyltransferase MftF [Georgenia sp. TF02-10]|uniref:mycofactocin biosynthesis glycosyltransferase MftF n=1 Tax=Georgenia sp. TF02-10 TaxID=2917725 RepID=UPI001FA7BDFF|nr:mycofactocin biosynthesis glycosyltransferase MftF [Georgenia sp. TF02-10]UNX54224.1 mycofactocin biosynthesis glycosyltransferase MftF [Georgenia sp. TF02-10]
MAEQTGTTARRGLRAPSGTLPAGTRVAWDRRARLRQGGEFVLGGAPWGVVRLTPPAQRFARRVRDAGPAGLVPAGPLERRAADLLLDRGIVHPVVAPRPAGPEVTVVIPAHDRLDLLEACLRGLGGLDVLVVDDASHDADGVRRLAERYGARLVRHPVNQGPGAARNTGLAHTDAPVVAFLDSDCTAEPGWLDGLLPHFDDPRVGAVAPRVRPRHAGSSVLGRHEDARSSLDMGRHPALVRHGAMLGFLPSAALVVRRDALAGGAFAAALRVGEDVDLVWRLVDAGWHVRYDPSVRVEHEARLRPLAWARRRYEYGTSAADLDRRHPGRLVPVRVSAWNLAAAALLLAGRPAPAAVVAGTAAALLGTRLRRAGGRPGMAAAIVAKGFAADALAVGHALRREWWPVGWAALLLAGRSRVAAAAAVSMLAPLVLELVTARPAVDPPRYALLRLVEDAAYGSGVLVSALRGRRAGPLRPEVRLPFRGAGRRG